MANFMMGRKCRLFIKAGGLSAGGSFVEVTNVRDVKPNMEMGECDVTTRRALMFEQAAPTLAKASIEFEMVKDKADAAFLILQTAFQAEDMDDKIVGVLVLDTEGDGLKADMAVFNFTETQALREAVKTNVTLKPTYSAIEPAWGNWLGLI